MKKRILAWLLVLAVCLGTNTPLAGTARAAGRMEIASAEDLVAFARRVNGGESSLDAVVTADIFLSIDQWEESIYPYDRHDNGAFRLPGYTGTFDGGGHGIYGLFGDYALFGKIGTGGVVKDLRVDGLLRSRSILAHICAGTISNCHVSGSLLPEEDWTLPLIGGIAAELGDLTPSDGYAPGTIVNCTSDVDISFYPTMVNYGYYNIGGIVGSAHSGVIDRCFFNGSIELQGAIPSCSAYVGGIVGAGFTTVINCGNTGDITADIFIDHSVHSYEVPVEIGGIAGHGTYSMTGPAYQSNVVNCWNTGNIRVTSTDAPAGCSGIGGSRGPGGSGGLYEMRNCWSTGTVTASSNLGSTQQLGSDTCYFLEGTNYNAGSSPTFSQQDLYNGALVSKLNDYVREHPGEGLMAWVQGPNGPELSDSAELPASQPASPSSAQPSAASFTDVKPTAYYYEPVAWAVSLGITGGTGANTFSPEKTCSRAEIVTFLYRFLGKAPSIANPFSDVRSSDYYYDAARWAYESGLVSGPVFGGSTPCTRLEAVTYLWKLGGSAPLLPLSTLPFTDVSIGDAAAVAWAAEQGITGGTGGSAFSPERTCSRAEIVTFLYRFQQSW